MKTAFTKEDFQEFIEEVENSISITLTPEEIENLTMAIGRTKGEDLSEQDVINAIEQYKRDNFRCILWRAVLGGLINLHISDDGNEISFVPESLENEK